MALQNAKVDSGHAVKPILFCYYHALNFILKALLRLEHSAAALRIEDWSRHSGADDGGGKAGLVLAAEDRDVLSEIDIEAMLDRCDTFEQDQIFAARKQRRTCERVRDSVGALLARADVQVRL